MKLTSFLSLTSFRAKNLRAVLSKCPCADISPRHDNWPMVK